MQILLDLKATKILARTLSSLLLIPVILCAVCAGGLFYQLLILTISIIMLYEWRCIITHRAEVSISRWQTLGMLYVLSFALSMLFLRHAHDGYYITLWLFLTVWATDIFSYLVGTAIKGPKIAPKISPNKTWSGLLGGIAAATIVGVIFYKQYARSLSYFDYVLFINPLIAIVSTLGDLLESKFKRYFGVKDSGNLIPGHGGVLDKVDGLVTSSMLVVLIVYLRG
ncbi:phosphatidate cytidylyltransferase [Alphaproteobacteria bacterium]